MKHFQLPESNKSMIPLVEYIFLSAPLPGMIFFLYTVLRVIQTLNKKTAHSKMQTMNTEAKYFFPFICM